MAPIACKLAFILAWAATCWVAHVSAAIVLKTNATECDVVIIGGGAAGANAAVFLKDKGYSVCLLEKLGQLGGHCHTSHIEAPPGCASCPNWIDAGVQVYENTTWQAENGLGTWNLASGKHIQRFVPAGTLLDVDFHNASTTKKFADLHTGGPEIPTSSFPAAGDVGAAYVRFTLILTQYPWIETAGDFPDPIPSELLLPFSKFITLHKLQALVLAVFVPGPVAGGLGSFSKLTTLYALQYLRRGITALTQPTKSGLIVVGGCSVLYAGIQDYLGNSSVYLNATVLKVTRPRALTGTQPIRVLARVANVRKTFLAKSLVIAIPQKSENLRFLDADSVERRLFNMVRTRVYAMGILDVTYPAGIASVGTLVNLDSSRTPPGPPKLPALTQVIKPFPYGPSYFTYSSDGKQTRSEVAATVAAGMANTPPGLVNSSSIREIYVHDYQPYFFRRHLGQSPTPYTRFSHLQGRRRTFYAGALLSFAESVKVWEATYNLVQQHF